MVEIRMLQRYRVDRQDGMSAAGPEKLVILVLKSHTGPEVAFAISKYDAMLIGAALQNAATEVQAAGS